MATSWITPKEDWTSNDGLGFGDTNRIEGNIDYIRNQNADFFGMKYFDGLVTFSSSGISSTSGTLNVVKPIEVNANNEGLILGDTDFNYKWQTFRQDLNGITFGLTTRTYGANQGFGLFKGGSGRGFAWAVNEGVKTFDLIEATDIVMLLDVNGSLLLGDTSTNDDLFQAKKDQDVGFTFGRIRYGSLVSNLGYISHIDNFNTTDYNIRMTEGGELSLNSKDAVRLRRTNSDALAVDQNTMRVSRVSGQSTFRATSENSGHLILDSFDSSGILYLNLYSGGDVTLGGNLNPTNTPSEGTWTIPATGFFNPPRGIYNVNLDSVTGETNYVIIEMEVSGVWREIANGFKPTNSGYQSGSFFACSGANIRISTATTSATKSVYYQKY